MDGLVCCRNEKRFLALDLLEQYRKALEKLVVAFNAMRYATCDDLMNRLGTLTRQLTVIASQPIFTQKQSAIQAEQLRIQELQMLFYERSQERLNDLLKQIPRRTQLNRLEKFL